MSNEIIEFKDDAGMPVKFTSQDIRERLCPNATDSELALCVELCNRQHLNPFTKEVYLVKYGSAPASIITSYQVFNRRAASWMEEEIAARKAQPEPAAPEPEPAPVYEPAPAEYATDDDLLGGF